MKRGEIDKREPYYEYYSHIRERERERERERDDRGRVLRVPLVAPPSLFQPRDGVGFDRYDDDDDDDDDDDQILFTTHTRNVSLSLSFFSSLNSINWELDSRGGENVSLSLSVSLSSFVCVCVQMSSESRRAGLSFFLSLSFSALRPPGLGLGVDDRPRRSGE